MVRRLIIRGFFLGLLLLCAGAWGWSHFHDDRVCYSDGDQSLYFGVDDGELSFSWNEHDWWAAQGLNFTSSGKANSPKKCRQCPHWRALALRPPHIPPVRAPDGTFLDRIPRPMAGQEGRRKSRAVDDATEAIRNPSRPGFCRFRALSG